MAGRKKDRTNAVMHAQPRRTSFDASFENNQTTLQHYYQYLKDIRMCIYKWNNLPPTVDERYLELMLCELGFAIYFNDENIGNICLGGNLQSKFNVYGIPIRRTAIAYNTNYRRNLTDLNSVIIWNRPTHAADELTIQIFAERLTSITRTIDVNMENQKTPKILTSSEQQRLTVKNLLKNVTGNVPYIVVDNLLEEELKSIDISSPFISDKCMMIKNTIINEYLTYLGVENSNADKKERLVSAEIGANYGNVEMSRNIGLMERQRAAEQINKMFSTDITVEFNSNLFSMINRPDKMNINVKDNGDKDLITE